MTVQIPIELDKEFIESVVQLVLENLNELPTETEPVNELPPYPTRKQVKKILHIGDHRLNHWIAHGLKVIPFGKETRFDREDIKNFLNQQKI
ncbi:helix-turn-helix domain-containing protein [Enterococcus avium]|uniref:helix-turn-helix domain-containing protein n=1 Tax=Enterococcus avium TaxID=33945 RepID=UPI001A96D1BC|nr:helix-turn-helix domain-containing protein [Enterococcus avium]MBO1142360.1 helix-turn-helix domain-containing protein [Enterococcus avium]